MTRPIVIVESPFNGETPEEMERYAAYARAAVRDCIERGEAPFASHLLYTQPGVLDDAKPEERALGIETGFAFRRVATRTVVYGNFGISSGMLAGMADARLWNCVIEHRHLEGWRL